LDLIIIVSIVFFGLNCGSFDFFFLLLLPKITNYIGKLEMEYEMILKRTLQSICILPLNPNTTTSIIVQVGGLVHGLNILYMAGA
jgi:hypothetical protein